MELFEEFLEGIDNPKHRTRTKEVLDWVTGRFPDLTPIIKWNQPMFTDHGTYIIGFSISKRHLAVAPEKAGINQFLDDIVDAGYDYTKELVRFPWDSPIDYGLLEQMISFNIRDKTDISTFWR